MPLAPLSLSSTATEMRRSASWAMGIWFAGTGRYNFPLVKENMSYKDFEVPDVATLADGEMKQVSVDGTELLIARVNGEFHAIAAHCTHYGAPLVDGVLNGNRLVCPWHHACFNAKTGDNLEPPALDSLPCFDVRLEDNEIIVRLPDERTDRRVPIMSRRDAEIDSRLFVILGGGAAGYAACQTLRQDGFKGRVLMITRESRSPYDRPNLSKDYLEGKAEAAWMPLRSDDFYADHDIEILRERQVASVDAINKTLAFASGETTHFDKLLLATGGEPRSLNIPGSDLNNIFVLRSYNDADKIIDATHDARKAVVIGASFIGMESAFSLASRKLDVTVVAPDHVPFERTLGKEIGEFFRQVHEEYGVQFKLGATAVRFEGRGQVHSVVLESGERIEADLVLVGVGVRPSTHFVKGLDLTKDLAVAVDLTFRAAEDVYAAGDIAVFPSARTSEKQRVEHWRVALQQGRIAAHNMAGKFVEYRGVPFFWTQQFDAGLIYVGHASRWTEIIYDGAVSSREFLAFYVSGEDVLAVAGMNRDRDVAAIEELLRLGMMPKAKSLRSGRVDFARLLNSSPQQRSTAV